MALKKDGPISLRWDPETVKALQRSFLIIFSIFTNSFLSYETIYYLSSQIFFLIIYVYSYKLGCLLISKTFGILLAICISANVYVNQLIFGFLEPQLVIYLILLLSSLFYILKLCKRDRFDLSKITKLSIIWSFCFFNGYPNTQLVLPIFCIVFFSFFIIQNNDKEEITYIHRTKTKKFFLSILIGFILYILFSAIYSSAYSERWYYTLSLSFDRFYTILKGNAISSINNDFSIFVQLFEALENFVILLSKGHYWVHAPHQPGMLLNLPYFNFIELFFLVIGIIALKIVKYDKYTKMLGVWIIIFVLLRLFTNDNFIVDKDSFDYFILLNFLVAIGFYSFIPEKFLKKLLHNTDYSFSSKELFKKIFNPIKKTRLKILSNLSNKEFFLFIENNLSILILVIFSLTININTFNKEFKKEFDASLFTFNGTTKLRNFLDITLTPKTLLVYQRGHDDNASLYRLNFFRKKINLITVEDFIKKYKSLDDAFYDIYKKKYDKILLLQQGEYFNFGKYSSHRGSTFKHMQMARFFDWMNPIFVTKSFKKMNTYEIYDLRTKDELVRVKAKSIYEKNFLLKAPINFKENYCVNILNFDKSKNTTTFNCSSNKKLSSIKFSGFVKRLKLYCNKEIIFDFKNHNRYFDQITINRDGSFSGQKFLNWNSESLEKVFKKRLIKKNLEYKNLEKFQSKLGVLNSFLLTPKNRKFEGKLSFKFNVDGKITSFKYIIPYIIFNDIRKKNYIKIKILQSNFKDFDTEIAQHKVTSNGKNIYGIHSYLDTTRRKEFQSFFANRIDKINSDRISINFNIYNNSLTNVYGTGLLTNDYGYEQSKHYYYLKGKLNTNFKSQCTNDFDIFLEKNEINKVSVLENDIIFYFK